MSALTRLMLFEIAVMATYHAIMFVVRLAAYTVVGVFIGWAILTFAEAVIQTVQLGPL